MVMIKLHRNYNLILVNRQNPLSSDFTPPFLTYCRIPWEDEENICSEKHMLTSEACAMLEYMYAVAKQNSVFITGVSGYRSYERQKELYDNSINKDYIALPGASEHQTGLAVDLSTPDIENALDDRFEFTDAYRFLLKHGARFGFILRYPRGFEDITGYPFESWHFRYVGRNTAMTISERGISLEQYFDLQNGKL